MNDTFILSAQNPLLFLAFCFEYKNMVNTFKIQDTFMSHLPIQLDASCNGLQHLTCIINDSKLAQKVNIIESDTLVDPQDLYTDCVDSIKQGLAKQVKKYPIYSSLLNLIIDRKLIKRSIMTIPYNVTIVGIMEQLETHFEKKWNLLGHYEYIPLDIKSHGNVKLTTKDLMCLATVIHDTLYEEHPNLKALVKY